jgi:hypothetical protein
MEVSHVIVEEPSSTELLMLYNVLVMCNGVRGVRGGRVWFYTSPLGLRWPIAQSVRKDGHLVFFIRGIM